MKLKDTEFGKDSRMAGEMGKVRKKGSRVTAEQVTDENVGNELKK